MTKTKAQLRAEAVERLKTLNNPSSCKIVDAITGSEWMGSQKRCKVLIDLLTDDEPQDVTTPEFDVPLYGWHEGDTREKLEADLLELTKAWKADDSFMSIYSTVAYAQVKELLDRQAAITRTECERFCDTCRDEQVDELEAECDARARALDFNLKHIHELQEQVDDLTKDVRYYHECNAELEAERDELQERVDNLCASEEIGNKLIMEQLKTDAEQNRTIVEYAEKVAELEAENEKLKEELRLVNTYSGVKGCECETTVFGMKLDEVRGLKAENERLRENLDEPSDGLCVLNAIDRLRRELSGYHGQLKAHDDLQRHCDNQRERIAELEGLYAEVKAERDELREKLSRAYDNAHDTITMVDASGEVVS